MSTRMARICEPRLFGAKTHGDTFVRLDAHGDDVVVDVLGTCERTALAGYA